MTERTWHSGPRTRLLGLGTALPPYRADQRQACAFVSRVLAADTTPSVRERLEPWLERLYAGSGIETRQSVLPDYLKDSPEEFAFFPRNWALEPFPTTAARMKVYEEWSVRLAHEAAARALAQADVAPRDVTHLLFASCTGLFAPGPDVLLIGTLGLRPEIKRAALGFMGCHAGFNGLRLADEIVGSEPSAVVLQVCVELCSLHFQKRPEPDLQVGNSLFADGAAAAVYGSATSRPGAGIDVLAAHSRVAEDSLGQMTWRIGDTGFEMRLDKSIPQSLRRSVPAFARALLDEARADRSEVAGWAVHPGGKRILDETAQALELAPSSLRSSFEVLREHGNMSSATIFFVLERALNGKAGPVVALGFGPGLTMEGAVLRKS